VPSSQLFVNTDAVNTRICACTLGGCSCLSAVSTRAETVLGARTCSRTCANTCESAGEHACEHVRTLALFMSNTRYHGVRA
jgi:hypothetical protein